MAFQLGKGTCQVAMPKNSAMGWKSQMTGSSTVKWLKRTCFVQAHCSPGVGILFGWSFHLRKYGIASMMIHGIARPKYTTCGRAVQHTCRELWAVATHLVQQETGETGGKDRVADPEIPRSPLQLDPVELREIGGRVEDARVVVGRRGRVRHRGRRLAPGHTEEKERGGGGGWKQPGVWRNGRPFRGWVFLARWYDKAGGECRRLREFQCSHHRFRPERCTRSSPPQVTTTPASTGLPTPPTLLFRPLSAPNSPQVVRFWFARTVDTSSSCTSFSPSWVRLRSLRWLRGLSTAAIDNGESSKHGRKISVSAQGVLSYHPVKIASLPRCWGRPSHRKQRVQTFLC